MTGRRPASRHIWRNAILFFGLITSVTCLVQISRAPDASATTPTVVSLTFDDGRATAYSAGPILQQYGMHATFYVNTGFLGSSPFYMTWPDVQTLYSQGNEIGGHTAYHADLPAVDPSEAARQICDDRQNLLNNGINATDFAYPYGHYNASVEQMVQNCGYNSARTTDPFPNGYAESISPANPYAIAQANGSVSLTTLEATVTTAEQHGGGWVPLTFHDICAGCSSISISSSDFSSLLSWLQGQSPNGVAVQTVAQVVGGPVNAAVPGPAPPAAVNGVSALRNASLEIGTTAGNAPDCFAFDNYGTNSFAWNRVGQAHSGNYAEQVTVSNYSNGDAKLESFQDLGACTPTVTPGHQYIMSEWYESTTPVSFTVWTRKTDLSFPYWVTSPTFAASSTWTKATWTTPVVPPAANGLSFGLTLAANGTLTIDDFAITDANPTSGPDTVPPTVSLTAPSNGATVSGGAVPLTASASDNLGLDHIDYLVDGSVVGSVVDAPPTYSWNSRTVPNGTHTVAARAVDTSGNSTTTPAVTVFVNNQLANLLVNPSLESASSGSVPTCWLQGGYGTNSYTWTHTTDAHSGSFAEYLSISSLTSGDRKLVTVQDSGSCAPAVTAGRTYTVGAWYKSTVQAWIFAYYRQNGNWIFWTQSASLPASSTWTQATWSTPPVPSGATNISVGIGIAQIGSITMDDFSLFDNSPPADTTPPTATATCNGNNSEGGCAGWFNGPVKIALSAVDNPGGSGINKVIYTTDGSVPSSANGTVYSGPFTSSTTVKYIAYDNSGNASPVYSQPIQIDGVAPNTQVSCNSAPCTGGFWNSAVSVTLSATDAGGSGVRQIYFTTDGTTPSSTNGSAYVGAFSVTASENLQYTSYDNAGNEDSVHSQQVNIDTVPPISAISCNGTTCQTNQYSSPPTVALSATDNTGGSGVQNIVYTTDGTAPSLTNGTVYSAPFTLQTTTNVEFRAFDNAGNAEPVNSRVINVANTSVQVTAPTAGQTVSGTTSLSATVSGVSTASVQFLVDGNPVGTVTAAPYTVSWNSATVPDGSHNVVAQATSTSGSSTSSSAISFAVSNSGPDTIPPTSSISCNGTACSTAWYSGAIAVSLSATDNPGGTGVKEIVYTTDGSTPTLTNGTVYGGAFSVPATTTIEYRAYDNAGNAEIPNTAVLRVDSSAPTSGINCNQASCSTGWYSSAVSVSLSATDNPAGSGIMEIVYTTDGSTPTLSNGTVYGGTFSVPATTTIEYRAYDNAGNAEPPNIAFLHVDSTAPISSISCNSSACGSNYYNGPVSVSLAATDNPAGSGVMEIVYTTDGSAPSLSNGTVYGGAFSVPATTTIEYRAYDNAGNVEIPNSATIQIDTAVPTVRLTVPTTGSILSGSATLSATATDNVSVASVTFSLNGSQVAVATTSPYTLTWNSQSLSDGTYQLTATAVDEAGNKASTPGVTVYVANNNMLKNPSLESASGVTPTCWLLGGYGANSYAWSRSGTAHTGSWGENISVSSYTSGDRKLVSAQDSGSCAPVVSAGHTYLITGWYQSTAPVYLYEYYLLNGTWIYQAQSAGLPASSSWRQGSYVTPALPTGATNISVGIGIAAVGNATFDDLGLYASS